MRWVDSPQDQDLGAPTHTLGVSPVLTQLSHVLLGSVSGASVVCRVECRDTCRYLRPCQGATGQNCFHNNNVTCPSFSQNNRVEYYGGYMMYGDFIPLMATGMCA